MTTQGIVRREIVILGRWMCPGYAFMSTAGAGPVYRKAQVSSSSHALNKNSLDIVGRWCVTRDRDRRFRPNVTGHSAALGGFLAPICHVASTFRLFSGITHLRLRVTRRAVCCSCGRSSSPGGLPSRVSKQAPPDAGAACPRES